MASQPLITIGMPVRNAERYLEASVCSLLDQSEADFVLRISDNASSDGTRQIAEALASQDARITYRRLPADVGAVANFREVGRDVSTEFFMWASDDDLRDPALLARCLAALRQRPDAAGCALSVRVIDGDDRQIAVGEASASWTDPRAVVRVRSLDGAVRSIPVYGLFRTEILRRYQLYFDDYGWDEALLFRILLHHPFVVIDEPLFSYRAPEPATYRSAHLMLPAPVHVTRSMWRAVTELRASARIDLQLRAFIIWRAIRMLRARLLLTTSAHLNTGDRSSGMARMGWALAHGALRPRRVLEELRVRTRR